MTKHICTLHAPKVFGGSYGVGDTKEDAYAKAKKEWPHGRTKPIAMYFEADVPDGHELILTPGINGVSWYVAEKEAPAPAQG